MTLRNFFCEASSVSGPVLTAGRPAAEATFATAARISVKVLLCRKPRNTVGVADASPPVAVFFEDLPEDFAGLGFFSGAALAGFGAAAPALGADLTLLDLEDGAVAAASGFEEGAAGLDGLAAGFEDFFLASVATSDAGRLAGGDLAAGAFFATESFLVGDGFLEAGDFLAGAALAVLEGAFLEARAGVESFERFTGRFEVLLVAEDDAVDDFLATTVP